MYHYAWLQIHFKASIWYSGPQKQQYWKDGFTFPWLIGTDGVWGFYFSGGKKIKFGLLTWKCWPAFCNMLHSTGLEKCSNQTQLEKTKDNCLTSNPPKISRATWTEPGWLWNRLYSIVKHLESRKWVVTRQHYYQQSGLELSYHRCEKNIPLKTKFVLRQPLPTSWERQCRPRTQRVWVQILTLRLSTYMTMGKLLNVSVPQPP